MVAPVIAGFAGKVLGGIAASKIGDVLGESGVPFAGALAGFAGGKIGDLASSMLSG
jgi:outer membrane lipoprotein SlyB